ncbi:Chaperone DnaJ-domain superfamily protein [Euphorbia peplus]|nr:Chaperone DnaJ-domain superfamily protein [Euphorbia peplus]
MDESWRMRMGMAGRPRRRSMEDTVAGPTRRSMEALQPDDFADVFGGPPRSILSRKFSGDFTRSPSSSSSSTSFYEEIFRQSAYSVENKGGGRNLPAFRIPGDEDGFYSDVFGWEDGRRSRDRSRPTSKPKSKSNSSSVLSSEDLSPHRRPVSGDDVALSSFTSKLRPINVSCSRWNSTTARPEQVSRKEEMPYNMENGLNEYFRSSHIKVSRKVSSPETIISLEPTSHRSIKIAADELEVNSPASPVSSLCQEPEGDVGNTMQGDDMEMEEDEVMSSYVIEINSDHREVSSEAISIDEAIAWAKEKFHSQDYDAKEHSANAEETPNTVEHRAQQNDGSSSAEEDLKKGRSQDETEKSEKDMELQVLDEEIQLWSAGKETNIRMLLSTLHHILWPNSSWFATPLTSLIESSQVKKAYQKARLCLHPDKLQQRGATLRQKYVAEKAFSVLQDAWAAFISQDVFFN